MTALDGVEIGLGVALTAITLFDVFQSVVFPRPSVGRVQLSVNLVRWTWSAWRAVAQRPHKLQTREAALAAFAPLAVVGLLVLWGLLIIVGYALIFNGLHDGLSPQPDSFGTTLFFSAGRMLAFSVGGIEATQVATRIFTSLEAATGFGLFALVISLLFSLFSASNGARPLSWRSTPLRGAPSTGLQLLETCAKDDLAPELAVTFDAWRMWSVDVLETHLTYPLLFYFRSSHDNEAWANSFGAVMDAAMLVISTIEAALSAMQRSCTRSARTSSPTCATTTIAVSMANRPEWSTRNSCPHATVSSARAIASMNAMRRGRNSARCVANMRRGSTR